MDQPLTPLGRLGIHSGRATSVTRTAARMPRWHLPPAPRCPCTARGAELSLTPGTRDKGHSDTNSFIDVESESYSLALLPIVGGRVRAGAGPSLDMVLMSDAFGVVTTRYAVGVTLIGEARLVRIRSVDVGAIGGWHHVAFGDLGDFHGILGGPAVFQPGGFDPS